MGNLVIKYIFTSPNLNGSSVQTKVIDQIKNLNEAGAECKGVFFSNQISVSTKFNEYVDFVPVEKCTWNYFQKIGQRKLLDNAIQEYIRSNYNSTDFFYIRYPGASKKLYVISKKYGKKIISEHQSIEVDEIKSYRNENPFGLKPSKFVSWFLYQFYPVFLENNWGIKFKKKVKAIVTVTNEIAEFNRRIGCKNVILSTNGINVNDYKIRDFEKINTPLKLLFLKGTSSKAEWNGIERLIYSIDQFSFNSKVNLIICGNYIKGEIPERDYIIHLGYLSKNELDILIDKVDIGVSTLALYKKGLKEASVLKTREYISRGLPFIYAYTDPDLNENTKEFALEFPNNDSIIDMVKVFEFAHKVLINNQIPNLMNKYAEEHLDYKVKMRQLYASLIKLINDKDSP